MAASSWKFLNLSIELVKGCAKGPRQGIVRGNQRGPVRSENPKIELGIEVGDFQAVAGRCVTMRFWGCDESDPSGADVEDRGSSAPRCTDDREALRRRGGGHGCESRVGDG